MVVQYFCMQEVPRSNPGVGKYHFLTIFLIFQYERGFKPQPKLQFFNLRQPTSHTPQGAFMAILDNPRGVGSGGERRNFA